MLTLHFAPNSRAVRTLWLLEELGLEYELNQMAFHPQDLKSDDHRARHPLGRIPVLDDGDTRIYESGAIADLQAAFHDRNALQCGFCTTGMMVNAHALLGDNPAPERAEIRDALSGNYCRCTGYERIVEAALSLVADGGPAEAEA